VDGARVLEAIGMDSRIGSKYFSIGTPLGGPCLLPGTFVQTEDGLKEIQDIQCGDLVFSHDGKLHTVTEIHCRDYSGELVQIVPEGFPQNPLVATPDHPIWFRRRIFAKDRYKVVSTTGKRRLSEALGYENINFDRCDQVRVGDILAIPQIDPPIYDPDPVDLVGVFPDRIMGRDVLEMTPDLLRLIGAYIADGSTWHKEISIALHEDQVQLINEICTLIKSCCGRRAAVRSHGEHGVKIRFHFAAFARYLRSVHGHSAYGKRVPPEWIGLPREHLVSLLRGIWYGDGSTSCGYYTWATVSPNLFNFMKMVLLRLGIAFTTKIYEPRIGKDGTSHQRAYFLRVANSPAVDKMSDLLPLMEQCDIKGKKSVWFEDGKMFFHVRSVEKIAYSGPVYNLDIEGANSYMLESSVVHNCFPRDIESTEAIRKKWAGIYGMDLNTGECDELYEDFLIEKIDILRASARNEKLAIIGQAFKADTDCAVSFGSVLKHRFEDCFVYDPVFYPPDSLSKVMDGAGVIVVTRRYDVEKELPDFYNNLRRGQIVFDPWRTLDEAAVAKRGAEYETVGRHITLSGAERTIDFFSGKNCLVTGGTGMIGRQVCRFLVERGARVSSISLEVPNEKQRTDGVAYFHGDLTDAKICDDYIAGADIVFHVAGIKGNPRVTESQVDRFYTPMLQMNTNVIASAIKHNIERLVFVSSIGAYPAGYDVYTEDITGYPMDLPGLAKLAAEEIIRAHIERTDATWSIVRPSNCFGPGDNFDIETGMVIPSLIAKAGKTNEEEDCIDVWGNGKAVRDFIYVDDVARGILLAAELGMYGNPFVNLGGKEELSIDDVVVAICAEFNIRWKYTYEKSGAFPRRVLDRSLAQRLWGWEPIVDLKTGIRKTVEWYISNGQEENRFNPLREENGE